MQHFIITLLQCSVTMSLISLVYMMTMPFLSKRYAAKWLYMIWLVIVAAWVVPFRPRFDLSFLQLDKPNHPFTHTLLEAEQSVIHFASVLSNQDMISGSEGVSLWWIVAIIWILGAIVKQSLRSKTWQWLSAQSQSEETPLSS